MIKCISLWQPYGSLVACGAKTIETRGWQTNYRGPILIHAAKKWNEEVADDCLRAREVLERYKFQPGGIYERIAQLPWRQVLGCIVAKAHLGDCRQMSGAPENTLDSEFGWFGPGRYGWILNSVEPVFPPIPYRGAQGLFDVPESVIG